jgi:hypothetical protein
MSAQDITVVATWPSVPVEVIRAAGCVPQFMRGAATPTPAADAVLEAGVFPNRIHQLFEAALSGRLSQAAAIVLPRTSDADYKAYLYLKQLQRQGVQLPPILLFDLLQSHGQNVAAYNKERCGELLLRLAAISGRQVTPADLGQQMAHTNLARHAARRLAALRHDPPRVRGAEVLPLLGALWETPAGQYVKRVDAAVQTYAARTALQQPRVLLAGTPVDAAALHASIEALQATVTDELSPYGNDAAAGDFNAAADPLAALAEWYGNHSLTARTSAATLARRIESALGTIDAVVMALAPDDARFGWDHPPLRATLARHGIAYALLSVNPQLPLGEADQLRVRAMLNRAMPRQAVRHG